MASPLDAIDAATAERLLSAALGSGGDYADLYFEYRSGADFSFEEGRVRTVGRGVILGLGVRVLRGDVDPGGELAAIHPPGRSEGPAPR